MKQPIHCDPSHISKNPWGGQGYCPWLRTTVSLGQDLPRAPSTIDCIAHGTVIECFTAMEVSKWPMMGTLCHYPHEHRITGRKETINAKNLTVTRRQPFLFAIVRNLPSCTIPRVPHLKDTSLVCSLVCWLGTICCQLSNFTETRNLDHLASRPNSHLSIILPTEMPCSSLKIFHFWPLFS